ncbi:MAG: hypothetical protein ABMA14_27675, partial [Hyphomonadaceae bacterium]
MPQRHSARAYDGDNDSGRQVILAALFFIRLTSPRREKRVARNASRSACQPFASITTRAGKLDFILGRCVTNNIANYLHPHPFLPPYTAHFILNRCRDMPSGGASGNVKSTEVMESKHAQDSSATICQPKIVVCPWGHGGDDSTCSA